MPQNFHTSGDLFLLLVEGNSWKFTVIYFGRIVEARKTETEREKRKTVRPTQEPSPSASMYACVLLVQSRCMWSLLCDEEQQPPRNTNSERVYVCACMREWWVHPMWIARISHIQSGNTMLFSMWFMKDQPPPSTHVQHTCTRTHCEREVVLIWEWMQLFYAFE